MKQELEGPMTDIVNRLLSDRLGLPDTVKVIGLDAAIALASALRDIPIKKELVYLPRTEPHKNWTDRPWWEHSRPYIGDGVVPTVMYGALTHGTEILPTLEARSGMSEKH